MHRRGALLWRDAVKIRRSNRVRFGHNRRAASVVSPRPPFTTGPMPLARTDGFEFDRRMTTDSGDTTSLLRDAIPKTYQLVLGITSPQWQAPTPCEGMDVAGLVTHLVGGLEAFALVPAAGGSTDAPELSLDIEDAALAYATACERFLAAWSTEGALEHEYEMPWGSTPGSFLMGFMVIEQVTHGWDLARATGQTPAYDDALVEATLQLARSYGDESIRVPGMFGPVVEISVDATPIDRLVAFLGRRP